MTRQLQTGDVVGGKYRLEKLLGSGSMGSVWAARNQLTDRAFAIKFMLPSFARDPLLVQRFLNEAKVCGRLDHPSVVEIYDLGIADELEGVPFLVMELLRGEGLDVLLERTGKLDVKTLCPLIVEIASALDQAHQRGIVHRDVKPSNIFLHRDRSGEITPKLLDFGVSKILERRDDDQDLTHVGAVLGSPLYMAPEQARGQADIDGRADLWALGVVLYEASSGQLPFAPGNFNAVLSAILASRHRPLRDVAPGLPMTFCDAVELCLTKDRNRRMASAAQLATRLEDVLLQVSEAPVSSARPQPVASQVDPSVSFDESTEVMSREDLLAVLPRSSSVVTDDDEAPLSRTSQLRRMILAELAPVVHTAKTDDISEKIPLAPSDRSVRVQRLDEKIEALEKRTSSLPPPPTSPPPAPAPPTDEDDEFDEVPPPPSSVDLRDDEQAVQYVSATSAAIRAARDHLQHPSSEPPASAPAPLASPPAPATPARIGSATSASATSAPTRGSPLWLVVAALLLALSLAVAYTSRR